MAAKTHDKEGFRLRGLEMTRTEGFTDAAFAFAVTLLVISTQNMPSSYDELVGALTGIPAFAASFALVMLFWHGHWVWSRRYGLEDGPTILLSAALVLVLLIYVYPLKYLYVLTTAFLTGTRVRGAQGVQSLEQLHHLFAIYGIGYVAMNLIISALNAHAYRARVELELNELESQLTRSEMGAWLLASTVGLLSVATATLVPPTPLVIPGWTYMLLPILMPIYGKRRARVSRALRERARPIGHGD